MGRAKNHWSCERFFSNNASVAIPWCRMTSGSDCLSSTLGTSSASPDFHFDTRSCGQERWSQRYEFGENSLRNTRISESLAPKGSATWPEEQLPTPSSLLVSSAMCKSQYKLLKSSCQTMIGCPHAWGMVIVTAGWDGRIRSFQNYGLPN